jgi:hypothetical protein
MDNVNSREIHAVAMATDIASMMIDSSAWSTLKKEVAKSYSSCLDEEDDYRMHAHLLKSFLSKYQITWIF